MSTPALSSHWPGGKVITILTRHITGQDALGNDIYVTVQSVQVSAILVPMQMRTAPRATRGGSFAEDLQGQYIVAAGYTAYLPPGTPVSVTDTVVIDGEAWRVAGIPGNYQSPWTQAAGCVQVELVRVTG